jgi:hypothetical protein
VLFAKQIVLTFAIASLNVLTQLFPMLNLNFSLGKRFFSDQMLCVNFTQETKYAPANYFYLSASPASLSCLQSSQNLPSNQVKTHMKIKFRQSGGYAGLRMGCDLDTNLLPLEEAAELQSLVEGSGVAQSQSSRSENAADLINYEITIETKEGTRQIAFDDLTLPESIIPLLDYLQSHAKSLR